VKILRRFSELVEVVHREGVRNAFKDAGISYKRVGEISRRSHRCKNVFSHWRSIAERDDVFSGVCLFVTLFASTITSERLNVG